MQCICYSFVFTVIFIGGIMKGEELKQLRKNIQTTEEDLKKMKAMLEEGEKNCHHVWGETIYTPETIKGYFSPAKGQGSHFESSITVPDQTIKKWTHECKLCGKSETTKKTRFEGREIPVF